MGLEIYRHSRLGVTNDVRTGSLASGAMTVRFRHRKVDYEFEVGPEEHLVMHVHEEEDTAPKRAAGPATRAPEGVRKPRKARRA